VNDRVASCFLLLSATLLLSAETQWPVTLPEQARDELIAVTLPTQLYANGQADAATLRIRDGEGGEIPARYEPVQIVGRTRRRIDTPPLAMVAAETPANTLRLTVRRPRPSTPAAATDAPLAGLTVQTALRDFEQQVTVEVSDDGVNWSTVVQRAALFDLSRHANVRRTEIAFPAAVSNRLLRLTFEQAVDSREHLTALITTTEQVGGAGQSRAVQVDTRPFRVDAVCGWITTYDDESRKPVLAGYPVAWSVVTNGVPRDKTRYAIEAQGQPLTQLTVAIPADYASWRYTLTAESPAPSRFLAQGMLTQFRFRGITDQSTAIDFSEVRAERYVLTLDQPQAALSGISATGSLFRLVFPAQPRRAYTLVQLPDPDARIPSATHIGTLLDKGVEPLEGKIAPTAQASEASPPWAGKLHRYLLPGGIVIAMLALAFSLVKAMRRL
jgi:hypothetical protein